jgi:membrane protease subunit (stomatin/prohibitin family)
MALDVFRPGAHTLSTSNIPLLQKIINLPFGGKSPFAAEIYFVNRVARLDLLWGTTDPIQVIEPKFQIITRVRSHGQMGIRVDDSRMFISQMTGAMTDGGLEDYERVQRYFKGLVVNTVKKALADSVVNGKVSLFDISAQIDTLSIAIQRAISDEFKRFGISVLNFYIESINVIEDDIAKLRGILKQKAEFEVLGDDRYTRKRTFDTLEKAAENPGGGLASAGVGLGVGLGAGVAVGGLAADALKKGTSPVAGVKCASCQKEVTPNSQFCNWCGAKVEQASAAKNCPKCNVSNSATAKFCNSCGASFEAIACPKCHAQNAATAKFCSQCGAGLTAS